MRPGKKDPVISLHALALIFDVSGDLELQNAVAAEVVPFLTPVATPVDCRGEKPAFYYPIPSSNFIL